MENSLSRRGFIAGAAATSAFAMASLWGCSPSSDNGQSSAPAVSADEITWDREADVVICGGGGTGLAAAVEAAQAGVETLVFEKSDHVGGTTALSGGMIMVPYTEYEKKFKDYEGEDSPEMLYEYYIGADEMGGNVTDHDLVKDYCEGTIDNLKWCESLGIEYVNCFAVKPVPGVPEELSAPPRIMIPGDGTTGTESAAGTGRVHTEPLYAAATEAGAEFVFNATVQHLITDDENGVIGVVVKTNDGVQNVKAKRGVVMATGGYEHNEEMARAFSPWQYDSTFVKKSLCLSQDTNTGDGHRMGMEIGAQLACMGITMNTPICPCIGIDPSGSTGGPITGIAVNKYGARYCNEWTEYTYFAYKTYQQDDHMIWLVYDQPAFEQGMDEETAAGLKEAGTLFSGNTIEEAAEAAGINAAGLKVTLDAWNADMAATGKDSVFGKTEAFGPISTPPYYIETYTYANLGTLGGLKITTDAQVVDWEDKPIPRLFAGGTCSGGWVGSWYPGSGTSVGGTVHWGRKGGRNAAALDPWC